MSEHLIKYAFSRPGRRPGVVYILDESAEDSPVKVGFTRNLANRLAILQTGNPRPLRVLHAEPATVQAEEVVQRALREARMLNEWFRPTADVRRFVAAAQKVGLREALTQLLGTSHELQWPSPPPAPKPVEVRSRRAEREEWHRRRAHLLK